MWVIVRKAREGKGEREKKCSNKTWREITSPPEVLCDPVKKLTCPPGNLIFLADNFLEKLQRKTIVTFYTAKECNIWWFLRFLHLCFSEILWFFLKHWTFIFEKQLWNAERGDSQNYVRKLHPLHMLQLPVFTMSFTCWSRAQSEKAE